MTSHSQASGDGLSSTNPLLSVRGLRFAFPNGHEVLRGVDLRVGAHERVALLGPNGAGKTTLAHHLNGINRAASGEIIVAGTLLDDATLADIRRRVGMVFQDANDQLFMPTVREDVAFGPANLGLTGDERTARVTESLASVGASDLADRPPHHLSGGERRRVAIATVLAMRPDLLVLDEPTSGLDPAGRRELIDLLASLPHAQIVITHDLPFALELCPRAAICSGGLIVADGPTAEILSDRDLLARHRLELPLGFDPASIATRSDR